MGLFDEGVDGAEVEGEGSVRGFGETVGGNGDEGGGVERGVEGERD